MNSLHYTQSYQHQKKNLSQFNTLTFADMTKQPFYNNFHFVRMARILIPPNSQQYGYAELTDNTIVEIRTPIVSFNSKITPKRLLKNQYVSITFTQPDRTVHPQAIQINPPNHIRKNP